MAITEFSIIDQYFRSRQKPAARVLVGIGDDAAVIEIPKDQCLVTSVDTLIENVHFLNTVLPADLGYKALAVSLSDIAAMGALPDTALLSLTLVTVDEEWLAAFSQGFFSLADQYQVTLIGGNITAGPLSLSVVVNGLVPHGQAICRSGAQVGDEIYVTGTLGDAGLALDLLRQGKAVDPFLLSRLHKPSPRVAAGVALRGIAHACIDISDGLIGDLAKITTASQVAALIEADQLPLSNSLKSICDLKTAWQYALASGDDYELCFTVSPQKRDNVERAFRLLDCGWHRIGKIIPGDGISVRDSENNSITMAKKGYEHFS